VFFAERGIVGCGFVAGIEIDPLQKENAEGHHFPYWM
jgi:hypothetical protein